MKFRVNHFALFIIVLTTRNCDSKTGNKENVVAEQETIQKEVRKQQDHEFGVYEEEVKPQDDVYYSAYDNVIMLWKTPFMNCIYDQVMEMLM